MGQISAEAAVVLGLGIAGFIISWIVWVTVSIFNQRQQTALLKQEVGLIKEVKATMHELRDFMSRR